MWITLRPVKNTTSLKSKPDKRSLVPEIDATKTMVVVLMRRWGERGKARGDTRGPYLCRRVSWSYDGTLSSCHHQLTIMAYFTVKATYRSETRKFVFTNSSEFPTYRALHDQVGYPRMTALAVSLTQAISNSS